MVVDEMLLHVLDVGLGLTLGAQRAENVLRDAEQEVLLKTEKYYCGPGGRWRTDEI